MDKVINIEEALKRIEELEKENAKLREELEYYRNRKLSGRQKHNAKWMAIYNDFVVGYESGMTMVEIAKRNNVSERTIYRYKEYKRSSGIYADVLSSLQLMQDYGVNLICVEDGIDSSKEAGKLLISIIAAVAEMERENIRVQKMAGREQKAREGKWNGGFAPYGYRLENGELVIAEDEVEIIQMIFDRYIHTNDGTKTRMICRWAIIRVLHYPDSYTSLSRYAFNLFFSSM